MAYGKGECEMNCGRDVKYPRHGLCSACYSSMRVWLRVKTPTERAERIVRLTLYRRRMDTVQRGALVIGEKTIRKKRK